MPIYEYTCKNCQHNFDVLQKIQDEPVKQCPQCQQDSAVRLVSAPGFQLKGTGWYVTDFKDKGKTPATESAKPVSETKKTDSTPAKSDSKKEETN